MGQDLDHGATDHVLDLTTVDLGPDLVRIIHEVDLDLGVTQVRDEDTGEVGSEGGTTIGEHIINPVSKIPGIIIKEVEVVVTIIIGIPGMAIGIIVVEVDSPATEGEDLEDDLIEADTEITETEGKFNMLCCNIVYHIQCKIY